MANAKRTPAAGRAAGANENVSLATEHIHIAEAVPQKQACLLGIDLGITGAVAFYFPCAPDRVAAEKSKPNSKFLEVASFAKTAAPHAGRPITGHLANSNLKPER